MRARPAILRLLSFHFLNLKRLKSHAPAASAGRMCRRMCLSSV
ncbi:hypothetical protein MCP1_4210001 [Candidatus Terasakiella magnetica]|nr:hypothetical protein MCP1_4210001 [Candidatus Terasakiella magnetica]